MIFKYPGRLLAASIILMIIGVVIPFLMVIHLVQSTFFLNFLSYAASTVGFFLGIISFAATRVTSNRTKDKSDKDDFDPRMK